MAGRTTKEVIKELRHELKYNVAMFPAFDAGLGQPSHSVIVKVNAMSLMQILSKVLTPRGSVTRPNPKVQERLGRLLVAAGVARKMKPLSGKSRRQTETEVLTDLIKAMSVKLDAAPSVPKAQTWLTPAEFKKATKCRSAWMIREWCRLGKVRCKKLDDSNPKSPWRILATEVDRYLAEGGFLDVVQNPSEA